jgi:hypothetical protein
MAVWAKAEVLDSKQREVLGLKYFFQGQLPG